ncbi:hypothetical protein [Actinomadura rudentiformis]|uniref:Uncharacterized protein n=1 Tax=Actinomadura rudentiformis TaxID=359158 RepID=A0A6H9YUN9_9ACTN|nr:hypothetical protein [Actinomadura rudentiformis]KAB2345130.1 hypothetical protein F8566_28035 [Actinomadura rudentiformis]
MEATKRWTAAGKDDGVLDAIDQALKAHGWREISRGDGTIEARFGSRLALRIWGVFLPPGRKRFPMRVKIAVDGSEVAADLRSDEGWYLLQMSAMDQVFMDHAARVFEALRDATGNVRHPG